MTNLTQEQNLVRYVPGVDSVPDHYLVVYKQIGAAREFRGCLLPGEKLKRNLFESPESFVAYAVPRDEHLRFRFSRAHDTHDQVHSFTLYFTVEYRVANPVLLLEKLHSDPIRRLEQEIDTVLAQAKKSVDWATIEREDIDLENVLFFRTALGDTISNLEKLRRFALGQGLELDRIAVSRRLADADVRGSKQIALSLQEQQVVFAKHGVEETRKTLQQDLGLQLAARRKGFERTQIIADNYTKNTARALDQITDGIRSFQGLQDAVRHTAALQSSVLGMVGGSLPSGHPGAGTVAALPVAASDEDPLRELLTEICSRLGSLACEHNRRRQLLSTCLHLVAEATRLEEANEDTLALYNGALEGLLADLIRVLQREEIQFLRQLQDSEKLRRSLG